MRFKECGTLCQRLKGLCRCPTPAFCCSGFKKLRPESAASKTALLGAADCSNASASFAGILCRSMLKILSQRGYLAGKRWIV